MLKITYSGIKDVKAYLDDIGKNKYKKVTAMALTATAKKYREKTIEEMRSVFDRPTAWTLKGVFFTPATTTKLVAKVWFKDKSAMGTGKGTPASEYLRPQIYGGARDHKRYERAMIRYGALKPGQYTIPGSAAKLDRHGNLSSGTVVKILTAVKALEGMAGTMFYGKVGGYQLGAGTKNLIAGRPKGKREGVWEQYGIDKIRPILLFTTKRPRYTKRLLFFEKSKEFCPATFKAEFMRIARETIIYAQSKK